MIAAPAVIDVEASGFGRGSYPIEVGFVLEDGTPHCYLVKPEPDWQHWDVQAARTHRIPRAALAARGLPVAEIAERMNRLLGNSTVYSDAWSYDSTWLALLFDRAGEPQRFRLESVRVLLDDEQASRWSGTRDAIAAELALERHRASADASIVRQTLTRLRA